MLLSSNLILFNTKILISLAKVFATSGFVVEQTFISLFQNCPYKSKIDHLGTKFYLVRHARNITNITMLKIINNNRKVMSPLSEQWPKFLNREATNKKMFFCFGDGMA